MPTPALLVHDNDATPICHGGDVVVQGDVRGGRPVDVKGTLKVEGDVGATRMTVGGVATIRGGIRADAASRYVFSGDLHCHSIHDAHVMARGDVHVAHSIAHSRLTCGGRIQVADGHLFGGDVAGERRHFLPHAGTCGRHADDRRSRRGSHVATADGVHGNADR